MNNYPNDILVGVSPAVFAFNLKSSSNHDDDNSSSSSSPFHRLLNSMTAAGSTTSTNSEEQTFWNRARIFPISHGHEFPKSSKKVKEEVDYSAKALRGILKAGWLEKHTRALPSVLLVVFEVSKDELLEFEAAAAELEESSCSGQVLVKQLADTIWELRRGLDLNKRECKLYLICLVTGSSGSESSSESQPEIQSVRIEPGFYFDNRFLHSVCNRCRVSASHLAVLHTHNLEAQGIREGSSSLRMLLKNIRESSISYYLNAARKAKRKERNVMNKAVNASSTSFFMGDPANVVNKELISLIIRYNFKIAVFYEFVGNKQEKCIKHYSDAYLALENYFCYINRNRATNSFNSPLHHGEKSTVETSFIPDSGVEVSLASPQVDGATRSKATTKEDDSSQASIHNRPARAADITFQCQTVAAWLHLKILRLELGSTSSNLLPRNSKNVDAFTKQCMRHKRVFLNSVGFGNNLSCNNITQPKWYFLTYVAHQKLLIAQLSERMNLERKHDESSIIDEVDAQLSSWRNYASTAETTLLLYQELQRTSKTNTEDTEKGTSDFLGGITPEGLVLKLNEERQVNHISQALEYVQRALQFYEKEQLHNKASCRSGTSLFYLAGRLLILMKNWDMAAKYLYDAFSSSDLYLPVKVAIGKAMIQCLTNLSDIEKYAHIITDLFFDRMTNNLMSQSDVDQISLLMFSMAYLDPIKREIGPSAPISFEVTFPGVSAEIGDSVHLSIAITSHLQTTIFLKSSQINFKYGLAEVLIPDGKLQLGPLETKHVDAILSLPWSNLETFPHRQSSSRLRPFSAGLTIAGGCVVSKQQSLNLEHLNNLKRLVGIPLVPVGLKLTISAEKDSHTQQELYIFRKGCSDLEFNENDNNFESAWLDYAASTGRNEHDYLITTLGSSFDDPVPSGPRCLRVHAPISFLEISDLTSSSSMGMSFDGGIYRVVLEVKAGISEWCKNLTMDVECTTSSINSDNQKDEQGRLLSSPISRSAKLVAPFKDFESKDITECKDRLPYGWGPILEDSFPCVDLNPSETVLFHFDVYMPANIEQSNSPKSAFKTEYCVSFKYKQRRRLREGIDCEGKTVSCRHYGSIVWKPPLRIDFDASHSLPSTFPNGAPFPSNINDPVESIKNSTVIQPFDKMFELLDKQQANVQCKIFPVETATSSKVSVLSVRFKATNDHVSIISASSPSGKSESDVLFSNDLSQPLTDQSCINLSYLLNLDSKSDFQNQELQTDLGSIVVEWKPPPTLLPASTEASDYSKKDSFGSMLGPLPVPITCTFQNPPVVLYQAPFSVALASFPVSPRLSSPFDVTYSISNLSCHFQQLKVTLSESKSLLFSSLEHGQISIAPHETIQIGYTAIPLRAGDIDLPGIDVTSSRNKAWVIKDIGSRRKSVFVLP